MQYECHRCGALFGREQAVACPHAPIPLWSPPQNAGPFDWITTFPKLILDPRNPNDFDGMARHGFVFWNENDEPTDEDGEDYYPLFHDAMFDEQIGARECILEIRAVLKAGTHPPGHKLAGRILGQKDREALEKEMRAQIDVMEGQLDDYECLFGANARVAIEDRIRELSEGLIEPEPVGQLALFAL